MMQRPVYPLLLAAYTVVWLWARNVEEAPLATPLALLAITILLTSVGQWLLTRRTGDAHRAALITAGWAAIALSYGHLYTELSGLPWGRHRFLLVAALLAGGALWPTTLRWRPKAAFTSGANWTIAALLLLAIAQGGRTWFGGERSTLFPADAPPRSASAPLPQRPDVYHLVVDGYGRADVLADLYGFDNRRFLDRLRGLGFVVGDSAIANYPTTLSSLAATLNLDYLGPRVDRFGPLYRSIRDNRLFRWFHDAGYLTRVIAGHQYASGELPAIDRVATCGRTLAFLDAWMRTTMLRAVPQWTASFSLRRARRRVDCLLDTLEAAVEEAGGPKYVYFHVISPHPPYVFLPDGSPHPLVETNIRDWLPMSGYVDQVRFLNRRLSVILERVVAGDRPAIVVLHSDHGPAAFQGPAWEASDRFLAERVPILLAVRPAEAAATVPTGSPISALRWVANEALGLELPELDDHAYFTDRPAPPYAFLDVTPRSAASIVRE